MKTKEELNALKEEVETLSVKPRELTEKELEQITGGVLPAITQYVLEQPVVSDEDPH